MNLRRCLLIATLAVPGMGHAEVPSKPPIGKYQNLWKDSPFTAKPVSGPAATYNPLGNYVLLGVSPIANGHRVTLLNKRQPTDPRIVVETGKPTNGFSILEVIRKSGDPLATQVRMASGSSEGTVAFEEKYLKLTPTQPLAKPDPKAASPNSNVQSAPAPAKRQERPKIVRPENSGNSNSSRGSRGR